MTSPAQVDTSARAPWWRDEQTLKIVLQIFFAVAVAIVLGVLFRNLLVGLDRAGLSLGFHFLDNPASFGISEGIPYDPSESYFKAFFVGVVNTIWVSLFSIVLATALGLVLGIARLSSNWLARKLAAVFTEVFRNIPVLLIIFFWYQGVLLQMPRVKESYSLFGFHLSNRGLNFPSLVPTWWLFPAVVLVVLALWQLPKLLQAKTHLPDGLRLVLGLLGAVLVFAGVWLLAPSPPLQLTLPELSGFNFKGGWRFSVEFLALMLGLVTYTGAYIAEVVRGGIFSGSARAVGGISGDRIYGIEHVPASHRSSSLTNHAAFAQYTISNPDQKLKSGNCCRIRGYVQYLQHDHQPIGAFCGGVRHHDAGLSSYQFRRVLFRELDQQSRQVSGAVIHDCHFS